MFLTAQKYDGLSAPADCFVPKWLFCVLKCNFFRPETTRVVVTTGGVGLSEECFLLFFVRRDADGCGVV